MNIKQKIQTKRGEYTRKREKKFQYLKNIGQLDNYISQKSSPVGTSPTIPTIESNILTNWFQRVWYRIINFFNKWTKEN